MKRTLTLGAALALALALVLYPVGLRAEEHIGPHKGAVLVWGEEEFHLEVVTDPKAGTVSVYVYGNDDDLKAAKAKPIAVKSLVMTVKADKAVTLKLDASPQSGDPAGTASVFTGKHAVFSSEAKLSGTVSGKVGTKPYSGDFKQK
jgi:hypothetical protein